MTRGRSSAIVAVVLAAGLTAAALARRGADGPVAPGRPPAPVPSAETAPEPPTGVGTRPPPAPAPERKLSAREVSVLVTSLQEPPLRDPSPARERVLRTLAANRELSLAELRRVRLAELSPPAQASIRDALGRLGE